MEFKVGDWVRLWDEGIEYEAEVTAIDETHPATWSTPLYAGGKWWLPHQLTKVEERWLLTEKQRKEAGAHAPFGTTESNAIALAQLRHIVEVMRWRAEPAQGGGILLRGRDWAELEMATAGQQEAPP